MASLEEGSITVTDPVISPSNQFQPPILQRPITSTLDTWDDRTPVDYGFNAASIGRRPSWNVPSIAVTSESVNTIKKSAPTRYQSSTQASVASQTSDPHTNQSRFRVIANMAQSIKPDSDVQISFSLMIATSTWPQTVSLAIFRDGQQISQVYYVSTAVAGVGHSRQELATGTYVDTMPSALKYHTYDLRWHVGAGSGTTAYAYQKQRTFQVSNLRAI